MCTILCLYILIIVDQSIKSTLFIFRSQELLYIIHTQVIYTVACTAFELLIVAQGRKSLSQIIVTGQIIRIGIPRAGRSGGRRRDCGVRIMGWICATGRRRRDIWRRRCYSRGRRDMRLHSSPTGSSRTAIVTRIWVHSAVGGRVLLSLVHRPEVGSRGHGH